MQAPAAPLRWDAGGLRARLRPLLPGIDVEVVAQVGSTNSALLERARLPDADAAPRLLVAEHQTHGRGRLGRGWQSAAGASLTFSLALPLAPADWSGLSLAVGVALAEALAAALPSAAAAPARIVLKWPNDLWLQDAPSRGRKLGGVLIETVSQGEHRVAVVGVGLNLLPQPAAGLTHGYACLHELDAGVSAPGVLAAIAVPLAQALRRFERDGFAPFAAGWRARDLLQGQSVSTTAAAAPAGIAEGVDDGGALLLRQGAALHRIVAGEVSVRLQPAPGPEPGPGASAGGDGPC